MMSSQNTAATIIERPARPVAALARGHAGRRTRGQRWCSAALRACRAAGLVLGLVLGGLILSSARVQATGLDCPELGPKGIPNLLAGARQIDRMTSGNEVDLGNEIRGLIARVQAEKPGISNDDIIDVLIAAYCPVVARLPQASEAQKWRLMRQFDAVLLREVSASRMPSGSLILANVPLPPPVFQSLTNQAEAKDQTPAQYMATILTEAAKRK
ncbi:MAG: hypothetical protein R3D52_10640 [Xanthobacteraceae bacterium]